MSPLVPTSTLCPECGRHLVPPGQRTCGAECELYVTRRELSRALALLQSKTEENEMLHVFHLPFTDRQAGAIRTLLMKIGSMSNARYDQWLRYDVGDADTDAILARLRAFGLDPYTNEPTGVGAADGTQDAVDAEADRQRKDRYLLACERYDQLHVRKDDGDF